MQVNLDQQASPLPSSPFPITPAIISVVTHMEAYFVRNLYMEMYILYYLLALYILCDLYMDMYIL